MDGELPSLPQGVSDAYSGGFIGGALTPGLGTAAALRGAAWFGNSLINSNRYLRIGPGRMPKNGSLPAEPKIPRLVIGPNIAPRLVPELVTGVDTLIYE